MPGPIKLAWNRKVRVLVVDEFDYVVALIVGGLSGRSMKKRGEPSDNSGNLLPPSSYSLLQPLWEHAGRLKRDNFELLFACDTLNKSSWFPAKTANQKII